MDFLQHEVEFLLLLDTPWSFYNTAWTLQHCMWSLLSKLVTAKNSTSRGYIHSNDIGHFIRSCSGLSCPKVSFLYSIFQALNVMYVHE